MEAKDLAHFSEFISSSGFSTLMCIWFMYRMEKRMERMTMILTLLAERNRLNPMALEEGGHG